MSDKTNNYKENWIASLRGIAALLFFSHVNIPYVSAGVKFIMGKR